MKGEVVVYKIKFPKFLSLEQTIFDFPWKSRASCRLSSLAITIRLLQLITVLTESTHKKAFLQQIRYAFTLFVTYSSSLKKFLVVQYFNKALRIEFIFFNLSSLIKAVEDSNVLSSTFQENTKNSIE